MDISTYNSSQTQFLNITDHGAQQDHIPVTFGPTLLKVMNKVSQDIGGAEYMMGRSSSSSQHFILSPSKLSSQLNEPE